MHDRIWHAIQSMQIAIHFHKKGFRNKNKEQDSKFICIEISRRDRILSTFTHARQGFANMAGAGAGADISVSDAGGAVHIIDSAGATCPESLADFHVTRKLSEDSATKTVSLLGT